MLALASLLAWAPMTVAGPLDAPLPPTALQATKEESGIHLEWQPPLASNQPVTGYRVYRFTDTDRELIAEVSGEATSYLDASATGDYVYTYYATAMAGEAESPPSNAAGARYPHCFEFIEAQAPFLHVNCLFPLPIGPSIVQRLVLE